jgi:hypothetical protein
MALKANYIRDHMGVDAETFGKLIIEAALAQAADELGGDEKDVVTIPLSLSVSERSARGCVQVCYIKDGMQICVHKNV